MAQQERVPPSGRRERQESEREEGFVLIGVIVALVPVVLAVGVFVSTMQGRSSQLRTDLTQERALLLAESGIDDAIYRANRGLLVHDNPYIRQLGPDESFLVQPTHLLVDGDDNDGDGSVDESDEDVFQVVVTGTFGNNSRRIAAYLGPTSLFGGVEAAVAVTNPSIALDLNGNAEVDGRDYDHTTDTVTANPARPGIATTPVGTVAHLTSELSTSREINNVLGAGGSPSVGMVPALDLPTVVAEIINAANIVLTSRTYSNVALGTRASPQISYRSGDLHLSGNATGAGILLIDGDLRLTGNARFEGIVIVLGDLDNAAGNGEIYGSFITGPSTSSLRWRGNGTIRYSSSAVGLAASLGGAYTTFNGWQELAR